MIVLRSRFRIEHTFCKHTVVQENLQKINPTAADEF